MSSIPQEQQPLVAYPNTVSGQQHSNGSFGTTFIVLAVIIVISAIACFLGRLCSRKSQNKKAKASHNNKQPQNKIQPESHKFRIRPKEEDIELGFDKMRSSKGGGLEFGFDKKRNPKEAAIEFGFDKKKNPKDVGIEFGFDARPAGGNGGLIKPSENKLGGGE